MNLGLRFKMFEKAPKKSFFL